MKIIATPRRFAILVVDDHELVRLGVRALLQSQESPSGATVEVLEAGTLAEALTLYAIHEEAIDLVLLDIALPDTQGLNGVVQFRARHPHARIVVITGAGASAAAQDGLAQSALALGASAFLPKSANLREVVSFIRACGVLGSDALDRLPPSSSNGGPPVARNSMSERALQTLSPRHVPILQLILEGKNNREIAEAVHLSEGTVKNYVSTILLRFGVRSRAQLISSLR
ncbi:response regulator [Variovorax ginsengisoli]|uniref:DNA-binding NarL/FixJ family response regulator n=1 Tax=Variovorax ginsengisoli TaxID=363844 RepID=A0ABT9S8Y4_9BURK|nr:response regulator transcription factor [Variovorax ginsengisoli]MDP9900816.1 DNA-binding NarL/FixJ family response regulator [Variovorax ginsengisoli]